MLFAFLYFFNFYSFFHFVNLKGLGEEVPQTSFEINLNLSIGFNGYLPRIVKRFLDTGFV